MNIRKTYPELKTAEDDIPVIAVIKKSELKQYSYLTEKRDLNTHKGYFSFSVVQDIHSNESSEYYIDLN